MGDGIFNVNLLKRNVATFHNNLFFTIYTYKLQFLLFYTILHRITIYIVLVCGPTCEILYHDVYIWNWWLVKPVYTKIIL